MSLRTDERSTAIEPDEQPMIEAQGVPIVYADGTGAAEVHGDNVRITYYELQGPRGAEVRVPVLIMVRPLKSCGHGDMMRLIERALAGEQRAKPHH
jgi:hypothetical protein